ncbi:MAG: hypothetical protein F6J90_37775 [Moorea sp. SIOASIH]|uniref:hypothetical protein n=1 Tax=Moorena sp. SIOASIH TaxID=2607817 RepID=UPI0013B79FE9|nr:hypothetical protein [Moorena sp. SIOASIH]NEO41767.1 hypothetical protein [Moorena sp. SIOASIH]
MIRKTLVIVGIGWIVVGLVPLAYAQSGAQSSEPSGSVTLSGDTLRQVNGRTVSDDYGTFFPTSLELEEKEGLGNNLQPKFKVGSRDNVDIVFGDTIQQEELNVFPQSPTNRNTQKVQLAVPLRE